MISEPLKTKVENCLFIWLDALMIAHFCFSHLKLKKNSNESEKNTPFHISRKRVSKQKFFTRLSAIPNISLGLFVDTAMNRCICILRLRSFDICGWQKMDSKYLYQRLKAETEQRLLVFWRKFFQIQFFIFEQFRFGRCLVGRETCLFVCLAIFLEPRVAHVQKESQLTFVRYRSFTGDCRTC